jgi:hypothetical protein
MRLEMGLIQLTDLANCDEVMFWGKITTTGSPYYVAMGLNFKDHFGFPHKQFYFATATMEFKELPPLDEFNKGKAEGFNQLPFSGDPAQVLLNVVGEEGQ